MIVDLNSRGNSGSHRQLNQNCPSSARATKGKKAVETGFTMDCIYDAASHSLGVALRSGSGGLCRICKPNYHTYEGVLWGGRLPRLLLIAVVVVVVVVAAAIVVFLLGASWGPLGCPGSSGPGGRVRTPWEPRHQIPDGIRQRSGDRRRREQTTTMTTTDEDDDASR